MRVMARIRSFVSRCCGPACSQHDFRKLVLSVGEFAREMLWVASTLDPATVGGQPPDLSMMTSIDHVPHEHKTSPCQFLDLFKITSQNAMKCSSAP